MVLGAGQNCIQTVASSSLGQESWCLLEPHLLLHNAGNAVSFGGVVMHEAHTLSVVWFVSAWQVGGSVWTPCSGQQVGKVLKLGEAWCRQCGPPACGPSDSFKEGTRHAFWKRVRRGHQSAEATEWALGPRPPGPGALTCRRSPTLSSPVLGALQILPDLILVIHPKGWITVLTLRSSEKGCGVPRDT